MEAGLPSLLICFLSIFQSRRLRCSVRNAGTDETVVRAAAILSSATSISNNSLHCSGFEYLPVRSLSAFRSPSKTSNNRTASSSSFVKLVLKGVLGPPEASDIVDDKVLPVIPESGITSSTEF